MKFSDKRFDQILFEQTKAATEMFQREENTKFSDWHISIGKTDTGYYISGILRKDPSGLNMEFDFGPNVGDFHRDLYNVVSEIYIQALSDIDKGYYKSVEDWIEQHWEMELIILFALMMLTHFGTTNYSAEQLMELWK